MANRTTRTPKKEAAFLDALRDGQSVTAACIDAGFGRRTAYEWREADEDFRKAWDEAVDEGTDRMEDEAYRRAVQGTSKPVYQGKELVGHVQEYSDTLMIFMLKARRPEKFKERVSNEHSAEGSLLDLIRASMAKPKAE
jgi:hypothetical protein